MKAKEKEKLQKAFECGASATSLLQGEIETGQIDYDELMEIAEEFESASAMINEVLMDE